MRWLSSLAALLLVATVTTWVAAQCAMCKANIQSSGDVNLIAGLREGILLLLVMPYLIVGTIAFVIYRAYRAQRIARWQMGN